MACVHWGRCSGKRSFRLRWLNREGDNAHQDDIHAEEEEEMQSAIFCMQLKRRRETDGEKGALRRGLKTD